MCDATSTTVPYCSTCVGCKIAVRAKSRSLHTILCKSTILYVIVCMDRDFDTEIALGPRFCNRGCAKSRSDCMYVVWSLQRDHTIVWYVPVDSISCMVVVARPYYCTECTGIPYKLYGRCSATIQYTVHARGARGACVCTQRDNGHKALCPLSIIDSFLPGNKTSAK